MPRQLRLDAPGTLHHVIGRGIEGTKIFQSREHREDFIARLADLCETDALNVYAWARMGSHSLVNRMASSKRLCDLEQYLQ